MLARGRSLPKRVSYIPLRVGPPRLKRSRYLTFKKGRFGVSSVQRQFDPTCVEIGTARSNYPPDLPAAFSESTRPILEGPRTQKT